MDATSRSVATAVLSALVAVAAFLGEAPLVFAAALLAVAVAVGWPLLLRIPGRSGGSMVILLGGLGAVLAVRFTPGEPFLRELPVVFALSVLLAFVHELLRGDGRERVVDDVAGVVSGVLVAVCAGAWITAGRTLGGVPLVVTGAVALTAAAVVSAIPLRGWIGAATTVAAAVAAGAGTGRLVPDVTVAKGALIGLAVGVLLAALRELFHRVPALDRWEASLAAAALPVSASGIVVYVVGRVLLG